MEPIPLPKQNGNAALNGWVLPISVCGHHGVTLLQRTPVALLYKELRAPMVVAPQFANGAEHIILEMERCAPAKLNIALLRVPDIYPTDQIMLNDLLQQGYSLLPTEAAYALRVCVSDSWIQKNESLSVIVLHRPVEIRRTPRVLTVNADHSYDRRQGKLSTYVFGGRIDYPVGRGGKFKRPGRLIAIGMKPKAP